MQRSAILVSALISVIAICVGPTFAANVEVKMLNRGNAGPMVFEPALVEISPGDSVTFVPSDKGHNAETIPDMLPEGAEPFKGKINEEITVTFEAPGAYGVKCLPHLAMGMVMLIVVGEEPANLDDIASVRLPPLSRRRMDAALAEYQAE